MAEKRRPPIPVWIGVGLTCLGVFLLNRLIGSFDDPDEGFVLVLLPLMALFVVAVGVGAALQMRKRGRQ